MSEEDFMNKYNLKKAENTEDYLIKEDIGELYKKYIKTLEVAQGRFERIDKAIEYINKYSSSLMFDLYKEVFEELLDILKGGE